MVLRGKRIRLVPCTMEITKQMIHEDRAKLSQLLEAKVPQQWPAEDTKDVAPIYLSGLEEDPQLFGWGMWVAILEEENVVIGDLGFKGKPNEEGIVEIGYGMIEPYRNKGYATESAQLLIDWAFSQSAVKKVIAECLLDNAPSIRVLEKLNMKRTRIEDNLQKWELVKEDQ